MIGWDRETPSTVYAKVPASAPEKLKLAVPTGVDVTWAGLQGAASNAGPVVRYRLPE
jgi:hypothetical protein